MATAEAPGGAGDRGAQGAGGNGGARPPEAAEDAAQLDAALRTVRSSGGAERWSGTAQGWVAACLRALDFQGGCTLTLRG